MTEGYVYIIQAKDGLCKIGYSADVTRRFKQFARPCTLLHTIPSEDARGLELRLHKTYADRRIHGEWFSLDAGDLASLHQEGCTCDGTQVTIEPPTYGDEGSPTSPAGLQEYFSWVSRQRQKVPLACSRNGCPNWFEGYKRREGNYCSDACRQAARRARRTQPAEGEL